LIVSSIEIREIDPHDEPLLRQWWETGHATGAERPYDFFPPWILSRVALPRGNPEIDVSLLGAFEGETMVGSALLHLPLMDNLHLGYADILVPPANRRRGVGTRLLEDAEERAREGGRKILLVEAPAPPGEENAGTRFAAAMGYTIGSLEEMKVLDLAGSEPGWGALQTRVDERIGDYRIVEWGLEVPEQYVQGFCDLLSVFMSQIPLGELPLEASEWTPERLRTNQARTRDLGRDMITAAAIAPDGSLCGASDVRIVAADPRIGQVGITLVLPGHRGHRLGLAMKLASHRELRAAYPGCEIVVTGNAAVNEHMNAVNEKLGYRVVERLLETQKEL
jgi:GNAT superfamily N-acetyltransferase